MTNREFYTKVMEVMSKCADFEKLATDPIRDEIFAHAEAEIKKLDNRNANRSAKPTKTQQENAPIKQALLDYLTANDGQHTEGDLGTALGITHNKAGALARQLVAEGKVTSAEVKLPKVGKRKVYSIKVEE